MANLLLTLPTGEKVDVLEALQTNAPAAGFDYQETTLGDCADFLAGWYGNESEELQTLISFDNLSFLILDIFVTIYAENNNIKF